MMYFFGLRGLIADALCKKPQVRRYLTENAEPSGCLGIADKATKDFS
jgi:hypothetical protein